MGAGTQRFLAPPWRTTTPRPRAPARSGDNWRIARNAWAGYTRADTVATFAPQFAQSAGKLGALLDEAAAAGREVDIHHELGRLTLDVVGTTAFG